jgi:L-histidine N-alpha-methyltransferase
VKPDADAPDAAAPAASATPGLIEDVRAGLAAGGQKSLPSKYLYDEVGTALFEAITFLDAYGLTRADERLLTGHAGAIARCAGPVTLVAELGSGSGRKVRALLVALGNAAPTTYCPIDISRQAITYCRAELGRVPGVRFRGVVGDYLHGLERVVARRPAGSRMLVLFVGSTIGNFEREPALAFLRDVRALLEPGDRLLLGTDLVKHEAQMLPAYADPAGVTAAFNRNVLSRLNRELGADFDPARFAHEARWNAPLRRIEMHLRASEAQTVQIPAADLVIRFGASETIWTESSHKFLPEEPGAIGRAAGFRPIGQWIDGEWPFAETMLEAS